MKDYRITLDRRVKEKLERSHLCWRCGSRVWNTDEKCFRCDAEILSMNPVLSSAVRAALGVREDPNPLRDGQLDTFDKLIVVPVRPGHPREPGPQRFSVDQDLGVCYVREADWPKLRETLRARRAKANIAIDVQADEIVARVQR